MFPDHGFFENYDAETCFAVSEGGTKESGGVAAKSKNVEDHRCHGARLLLVARVVRLGKGILNHSRRDVKTSLYIWKACTKI